MAAKNEAKIKFTADTQQFTQGINNARTNMASLRAAMALSAAEFKNTGDKAEMLKNKQQLLNNLIQQSQSIQQNLNSKLEAAKRYYGEDSQEVQKLQTAITREQTAEQRLQTQLNETNEAIKDQAAAEKALESPLGQLTSKIEKQEKELAKLKTEYANVVLSEGKNSAAANDLRAKIDSLNIELNENKQKLKDATLATKDMSNAQQNANSGWTMAKGIVSNLATQGLHILIQKMKPKQSYPSDLTSHHHCLRWRRFLEQQAHRWTCFPSGHRNSDEAPCSQPPMYLTHSDTWLLLDGTPHRCWMASTVS